jgi:hypothetical protein
MLGRTCFRVNPTLAVKVVKTPAKVAVKRLVAVSTGQVCFRHRLEQQVPTASLAVASAKMWQIKRRDFLSVEV